jgi:hypothetical protein
MDFQVAQEYLKTEVDRLRSQFAPASSTVYELRVKLTTPLMISQFKTDVPVPGLPNLDGILQYAAFYSCAKSVAQQHPELATHCLWQVNEALRGRNWIDFPVPLAEVPIQNAGVGQTKYFYDCSVGLPVDPITGRVCYPLASEFWDDQGVKLKRVVDTIPLRRRVTEPRLAHRPIQLTSKLETSRGAQKALDNRMYNSALTDYCFYFRGDPVWVGQLLETLKVDGIGIGKKSSLGYGQIQAIVSPTPTSMFATFGHRLSESQKTALNVDTATPAIVLIKSIPTDELFRRVALPSVENERLFGSAQVRVLSLTPALAGYAPPHWLKRNQTAVAQVGSLLLGV